MLHAQAETVCSILLTLGSAAWQSRNRKHFVGAGLAAPGGGHAGRPYVTAGRMPALLTAVVAHGHGCPPRLLGEFDRALFHRIYCACGGMFSLQAEGDSAPL
jgi:hypothetical protein